ncbi:MAG: hypothetical protein ACLFU8_15725 [Anaerolineales bacterium]
MEQTADTLKPPSTTQALCPSCGRFVGPYETCPYCGTHLRGRLSLRVVKLGAALLALFGLLGLWLAARRTEIPLLTVEEGQGTMNMAYIRVQGRVVRSLTYDPEGEYLAFWVDDGTGEVRINAYRDVTRALLAEGRVPALGDEVEVAGTLRIREDYVSLTLNVPEHLDLERPPPVSVRAGSLTALDEGMRVRVAGEVRRLLVPYEGLTLITVRDDSGEVVVAVDETLVTLTGALPEVVEGQGIVVTGTVTLYRDAPQLTPASVDEIVLAALPPEELVVVEERALGQLSPDDEGGWYRVQGRIVALQGFKGGVKGTLDDGTDQVVLLLWESVYAALEPPTALDVGAEVEVVGEISVYEGELELVPEGPEDVRIRAPAPEIPWVEIGALSGADVGRVVRLRGVLGTPDPFSAGVKVPLDDGSGTITVLLWSNVVAALDRTPEEGALIEVVGEVEIYKEELELIPRSPFDWRRGEGGE